MELITILNRCRLIQDKVGIPASRLVDYPGGLDRCTMVIVVARFRARFFPFHAAFPDLAAGRRPHRRFRGLLKLHAYYGLPDCLPT